MKLPFIRKQHIKVSKILIFIYEFGLKTGQTDRFIKIVKINSLFTID